jgi:hypothetical protein
MFLPVIPDAPQHVVMRRRSGISRDRPGEIPCLRCIAARCTANGMTGGWGRRGKVISVARQFNLYQLPNLGILGRTYHSGKAQLKPAR